MSNVSGQPESPGVEACLIQRIEEEIKTLANRGLLSDGISDLTELWQAKVDQEPKRFINSDFSINVDALRNFKRLSLFVGDIPAGKAREIGLRNLLGGTHRGGRKILRDGLTLLKQQGFEELLSRYPCPLIGNPRVFRHQGFRYTLIWLKTIYLVGLLNRVLGSRLNSDFVSLDIGSSYGHFSGLVKQKYSASHHVLVDFPEQLVLAHYFLGTLFPDARIAGMGQTSDTQPLDRDLISGYDFVLVPCQQFEYLAPGSVDLVTNFVSLGEMSRKWFDKYVKSLQFRSAKYFFTTNRIHSSSTYDNDLSILDYPIWDPDKKLHFSIYPLESKIYLRRNLFFFSTVVPSPTFEYIGEV